MSGQYAGEIIRAEDSQTPYIVANSAARVALTGKTVGDTLYQTDTKLYFFWNGASWQLCAGQMAGYYRDTSSDPVGSTFTTITTIFTGSSMTIPAAQSYWVDVNITYGPYAGNDNEAKLDLLNGTASVVSTYVYLYTSAGAVRVNMRTLWEAGAGTGGDDTFTPVLKATRTLGAAVNKFIAAAVYPFTISLTSIGKLATET
jgi:hypothetical protein